MESYENEKETINSNKVEKTFSDLSVEEQIKKLEKRNLNFLKERREATEMEDKACLSSQINFNNILIGNLKMSLNRQ